MKKKTHVPGVSWTTVENGYEKTASQELIKLTLSRVMEKRRFVNLLSRDYQSGATVFVSIGPKTLTIDKPMEWPDLKKVRIAFKDDAKVWNHFTVSVVGEGKDTVKTKFPTELFRLQRRANFRVELPSGSKASFVMENGESVEDVAVSNISLGGLMMCFAKDDKHNIRDQEVISKIKVKFQAPVKVAGNIEKKIEVFNVEKGVCVRSFTDDKGETNCLGVKFEPRPNEEMQLMQFIRQLECNVLRKGLALQ